MTKILPNNNEALQALLHKVLLYRFTRNLDKELEDRKISHSLISGSTGRNPRWFNRSFNKLEDMKISTFIKFISTVNQIICGNSNFKPVEVNVVLNAEIFRIASVIVDLSMNDVEHLIRNDTEVCQFFIDINVYVHSLKSLNNVLSDEELEVYEQILCLINHERSK